MMISPRTHGNYAKNDHNKVYGEIDKSDMVKLIKLLPYSIQTMLDVGSGCGDALFHIAEISPQMDYIAGIEIVKYRHEKSMLRWERAPFEIQNKIILYEGNFEAFSFHTYDLVYCCNTMFDDDLNEKLVTKLLCECNLFFVLYTKEPKCMHLYIDTMNVNTTWQKKVPVYIFQIQFKKMEGHQQSCVF